MDAPDTNDVYASKGVAVKGRLLQSYPSDRYITPGMKVKLRHALNHPTLLGELID
jgi:hypothetical protein